MYQKYNILSHTKHDISHPDMTKVSGPCNSFYCLGHFKNVYDDDDDDDDESVSMINTNLEFFRPYESLKQTLLSNEIFKLSYNTFHFTSTVAYISQ